MRCSEPAKRRARGYLHISARRAFTLVELIVLMAVGALLMGLLIPAIGASRERGRVIDCATHAQQLGLAVNLYLSDFAGCLPQVLREQPGRPGPEVCPPLFGGKAGVIDENGVNRFGIADRPLNRYVLPSGTSSGSDQIEAFHSPLDRGGNLPSAGPVPSMYEAVGSSYAMNTRLLRPSPDAAPVATLVPLTGGPMPKVETPDRTWLLGTYPILNYDEGANRGFMWHGGSRIRANLLMTDMHVARLVDVAPGTAQATDEYTFKPAPEWPAQ